jgi:uncharacterized membrane protein
MRPFVTRFTFLLGLLLVLTGVLLNMEAKSTLALVLVLVGLVVTLVSLFFQTRQKKEEAVEEYPEPDPKDFEDNDDDTYTIEEQEKK